MLYAGHRAQCVPARIDELALPGEDDGGGPHPVMRRIHTGRGHALVAQTLNRSAQLQPGLDDPGVR